MLSFWIGFPECFFLLFPVFFGIKDEVGLGWQVRRSNQMLEGGGLWWFAGFHEDSSGA